MEWEELYDESGNVYWYSHATGESSWEVPQEWTDLEQVESYAEPAASSGREEWEELYDESGNAYYYNHTTGETSWEPPTWGDLKSKLKMQRMTAALTSAAAESATEADAETAEPSEGTAWEELDDGSGNTYFYNHTTGETSWDAPQAWGDLKSKLKMQRMTAALTSAAEQPEPHEYYGESAIEAASSYESGGAAIELAEPYAGEEWEELYDESGTTYYYNHTTGETSWEPPTWGDLKSKLKMQRMTAALTSAAAKSEAVPYQVAAAGESVASVTGSAAVEAAAFAAYEAVPTEAGGAHDGAEWTEQYDECVAAWPRPRAHLLCFFPFPHSNSRAHSNSRTLPQVRQCLLLQRRDRRDELGAADVGRPQDKAQDAAHDVRADERRGGERGRCHRRTRCR